MPNVRPNLKRSKWKLSTHEFYTAYHYALQYPAWKNEYRSIQALVSGGADPKIYEERSAELRKKIRMIEEIVKESEPSLYTWLLKGVTQDNITFNYLSTIMHIPCGKNMYYEKRRKFYYLLSKKI